MVQSPNGARRVPLSAPVVVSPPQGMPGGSPYVSGVYLFFTVSVLGFIASHRYMGSA